MILLYHLIFPNSTPKNTWNAGKILRLNAFSHQVQWLKKRYHFVSLEEYLYQYALGVQAGKRLAALTFDDGYQNTYDLVAPYLEHENVPATFFASTSHLKDSQLLWFVYFNALCSENVYSLLLIDQSLYSLQGHNSRLTVWKTLISNARKSGDAVSYSREFAEKYPLPENIITKYLGLTERQIREIGCSSVLSLGGHTHTHPYLDQLSQKQQLHEMITNKQILERISGAKVKHFAYTGGIYNLESISAIKEAGFEAALAVRPKYISAEPLFEIPRVDIYSRSLLKLLIKTSQIADLIIR